MVSLKNFLVPLKRIYLPGKANALFYQGRYEEVIRALEELRKIDPNNPDKLCQLGRSYFAVGRYQDAFELLSRAYMSFLESQPIPDNYLHLQEISKVVIAFSDVSKKVGQSDRSEEAIRVLSQWLSKVGEGMFIKTATAKKEATAKTLANMFSHVGDTVQADVWRKRSQA